MRKRMASFSWLAVAVVAILWNAAPAGAQQPAGQVVKLGEGETLTITGFISSTFFIDRSLFGGFGQGQNAEFATCPVLPTASCTFAQPTTDKLFTDADVRNTRIGFEFSGQPVLVKWAPKAMIEADFFGAFNGVPPFGDEQPQLRVRFAYVDLTNGRTTLRIGQYWSPMFGETPVSTTHLAFPLGYGSTGKIGWRFPGIYLYHDLNPGKPVAVQLQLAAFKGSGPAAARDVTANIGNGEASGLPQFEARLNFGKRSPKLAWAGYVVGHIDWKDTSGTGVDTPNLSSWGFEVGDNVAAGKVNVRANFYYGKALGQQFAHITQQGNIRGWGAWGQVGYDFTPRWSYFLFYGIDHPDVQRFATDNGGAVLPRQESQVGSGMLRFRAGRYTLGLEYFRAMTRWSTGLTNSEQLAFSVLYTI